MKLVNLARRHQRREDPVEECETAYATDKGVEWL
jgi:hypothetical protein